MIAVKGLEMVRQAMEDHPPEGVGEGIPFGGGGRTNLDHVGLRGISNYFCIHMISYAIHRGEKHNSTTFHNQLGCKDALCIYIYISSMYLL